MKKILTLAFPLIISQLISMALVLTDVWMMSRISVSALAAGGLGASIYFFIFIIASSPVGCVANLIAIARGAKIDAIGTFDDPIIFTSANAIARHDAVGNGAQFADWGGIIINGLGLTNQCTNAQRAAETCNVVTEGVTSYFGGNDNADDSGSFQYAKIWYAGSGPKVGGEGDDLKSLTLNAVGSG